MTQPENVTGLIETLTLKAIDKIQKGEVAEALILLRMVLEQKPNHVMALAWCGVGESLRGQHHLAVELFEKAHELSPFEAQILSNLGQSYIAIDSNQKAKIAFEKAYELNEKDAEASYYLGFFAEQALDFDKAIFYYQNAIEHNPHIRNSYVRLANIFYLQKKELEAFRLLCKVSEFFPNDRELLYIKGQFASKTVAGWHLPMLADKERNSAYEAAIKAKIRKDDIVLDIGTASGLLAMMAVRAGAKHVYACEMNVILAELAKQVIKVNGYADKITIIPKHSSEIIIGEDIPDKVDLLVTEIFDCAIIGEDALATLEYAQKYLVKSKGNIIPQSASLYGRLTSSPHLQEFHKAETISGFDLSPMTHIAHPLQYKNAQIDFETSEKSKVVSEEFLIQKFDFCSDVIRYFHNQQETEILQTGMADSVLLHFELELADGIYFSTKNTKEEQHWKNPSQILLEPKNYKSHNKAIIKTEFKGYFDFSLVS